MAVFLDDSGELLVSTHSPTRHLSKVLNLMFRARSTSSTLDICEQRHNLSAQINLKFMRQFKAKPHPKYGDCS
jgi:hypothetical protein